MPLIAPAENIRCAIVEKLHESRIQTSLHYPCVADFQAFAAWRPEGLPLSRQFCRRVITLPLFPTMKPEQVEEICLAIRQTVDRMGADCRR